MSNFIICSEHQIPPKIRTDLQDSRDPTERKRISKSTETRTNPATKKIEYQSEERRRSNKSKESTYNSRSLALEPKFLPENR